MLHRHAQRRVLSIAILFILLATAGCEDSPNRVVGDSNGFTLEQIAQDRETRQRSKKRLRK